MAASDDLEKLDKEITDVLEKETKESEKDAEIDRILKAFKHNAYDVLDLQPGVPEADIIKTYRKKSLLIHPDKTKNTRAPDAFDRLKKAHGMLLDEKERERLNEYIADARMLLIRDKGWSIDTHGEELQSDEFKTEWKAKTVWVIVDEEKRRDRQRVAKMREEGAQQKKEDEEIARRRAQRDEKERWEATRDDRIGSWRDFKKGEKRKDSDGAATPTAGPEKKKKKKMKVLA
ncbi:Heat shock protein DnaJ [Venturia nashicola]|uniref:Heat shock protein DnaJ n=1 Tax=Venturia nashicola TaxID=86259 RepID=A0A4Z1P1M8_9PEZI|nr:Heat shock protein DnaJ [Venturia nashicola]TLD34445.1 Heat shock protein DnaJ [Venturia nashicola]